MKIEMKIPAKNITAPAPIGEGVQNISENRKMVSFDVWAGKSEVAYQWTVVVSIGRKSETVQTTIPIPRTLSKVLSFIRLPIDTTIN
jgi:hypothetical protein